MCSVRKLKDVGNKRSQVVEFKKKSDTNEPPQIYIYEHLKQILY